MPAPRKHEPARSSLGAAASGRHTGNMICVDSPLIGHSGQKLRAPLVPPVTGEDTAAELAVLVAILVCLPLRVKWPVPYHLVSRSTEWAGGILIIMNLQEGTDKEERRWSPREWIRRLKFIESWGRRDRWGPSPPQLVAKGLWVVVGPAMECLLATAALHAASQLACGSLELSMIVLS